MSLMGLGRRFLGSVAVVGAALLGGCGGGGDKPGGDGGSGEGGDSGEDSGGSGSGGRNGSNGGDTGDMDASTGGGSTSNGGGASGGGTSGSGDAGLPPLDLSCLELNQLRGWAVDPSAIAELFTVATCDGQPVPACVRDADGDCQKRAGCLCENDFLLEEDGQPISVSESGFGVQESRGLRVYVTLVLDMSNSTSGDVRVQLIDGAKQFVDQLPSGREVYVGIQLFDGSNTLDTFQLPVRRADTVKDQLDALADYTPRDGASTNLNGAAVDAVAWLQQRQRDVISANDNGVATVGYIVLFTDGADTAGRVELSTARTALATARSVSGTASLVETTVSTYAVALRSDDYVDGALQDLLSGTSSPSASFGTCNDLCGSSFNGVCEDGRVGASESTCDPGTDCDDCGEWLGNATQTTTVDGDRFVFEAANAAELTRSFEQLGAAIAGQLQGTYLLAYCSPKRSGTHELTVAVKEEVSEDANEFGFTFDASGFAGGCSSDFLENSCGDEDEFPNGRCGGFNCGACDEQFFVCNPTTDQCVNACLNNNVCNGSSITNTFGFTQACEFDDISTCGAQCVDLETDATHCGVCNNTCPTDVSCVDGICDCGDGSIGCSGVCTDPMTDGANCGSCGNNCGSVASCVDGDCECNTDGLTFCSGACVDTDLNTSHCGSCGNTCLATVEECSGGNCECAAGTTDCDGQCVLTASDEANCLACGTECGLDEYCDASGGCTAVATSVGNCDDEELSSSASTVNGALGDSSVSPTLCVSWTYRNGVSWRAPVAGAYEVEVTSTATSQTALSISRSCSSYDTCVDVTTGPQTIQATSSDRDFLFTVATQEADAEFTLTITAL